MARYLDPQTQRLTAREELFVLRVFEGQSTIAAYRSAYSHSGLNEKQITIKAAVILDKTHIQLRLKEHRDRAAAAAGVDVAMVLNELVGLAFVDPTRIVRTQTYCCRYCHGFENKYQWLNTAEFERAHGYWESLKEAYDEGIRQGKSPVPPPEEPSDVGGYEFKKNLAANPHCDECHGAGGHTQDFITDSRDLSPVERRAIAGVKRTKYGVSIELRDRSVPLKMIADHLGMFDRPVVVQNPDGSALGSGAVPSTIKALGSDELSTLKTLLMKALLPSDNSVTDVPSKIVPDSNNIPDA